MEDSQDTDPQIMLKKRWALLIGWILLLAAPILLAILLFKIETGEDELGATLLIAVVPLLALVGICLAGLTTTTVTFHRYDSMTVTRGFVPQFLWWRRTKVCLKRDGQNRHRYFRSSNGTLRYPLPCRGNNGVRRCVFLIHGQQLRDR